MSSPIVVATIALQGASVAAASELSVRSLSSKRNKVLHIRICKFILGFTMAVKTILFLAFHASIGNTACNITGRISDFLYHISMTAGTAVLVSRVHSIVPIQWKKLALVMHISMVIFRLSIGIVDTCVVVVGTFDDGTCEYVDAEYWGPVYTLYDTLIDLYVTFIISTILITHIRSLALGDMRVNMILYTSVIYNNIIRSFLLTIANLVSAIFIITKNSNDYIMLVWPIINIIFVTLVGYDSDVTKAIRKLRQKHWNKDTLSSSIEVSLGHTTSISQPPLAGKGSLSKETIDDPEHQMHHSMSNSSSLLHTEKFSTEERLRGNTLLDKSRGNSSYNTNSTQD